MLELSQVIFGVRDLERATARLQDQGFTVLDGGVHPGVGTANRVVPLGASYVELLGVVDEPLARSSAYGRSLLGHLAHGDGLVRWSLRTDRIDEVAARLGLVVEGRARTRPDGVHLTWQAAGLDVALARPWLPFFMQWDHPDQYPGAQPVDHPNGATGVAWLELTPDDDEDDRLARWTEGATAPLRIVDGAPPRLRRVAVTTTSGAHVVAIS